MWKSRSQDRERCWTRTIHCTHCGCRTGLDGDKHLDERRHRTRVIHTIQSVKSCRIVDTTGLRHDFEEAGNETRASTVRLVQDRSQGGACWSFDRIENEVYEESGENLCGLEPDDSWHSVAAEALTDWVNWNVMAPFVLETARTYRKLETKKIDVRDRTRAQIASVEKEKSFDDNSGGRSRTGFAEKSEGKDEH